MIIWSLSGGATLESGETLRERSLIAGSGREGEGEGKEERERVRKNERERV